MLILSRMKRYTPEEIGNISQNFRYIVQKCSLSKSALTAIGDKISPNTYNRLYRYDSSSQWCPQEKTLKNIIDYFNENFFPSITIYDLIHKNLENNNFSPIQKLDCLKYYEGMYHCYYFTSDGDCHYGLLRIWNSHEGTSSYECEAVLGFFYCTNNRSLWNLRFMILVSATILKILSSDKIKMGVGIFHHQANLYIVLIYGFYACDLLRRSNFFPFCKLAILGNLLMLFLEWNKNFL